MNKEKNKIIKDYVNDVAGALSCSRSLAYAFRGKFESEIREFVEDKEVITTEMLIERFGSPESIAEGFLDRSDYDQIIHKAKKQKVLLAFFVIILALLLTAASVFIVLLLNRYGSTIYISGSRNI